MTQEYHLEYRPKLFKQVIGQDEAVRVLEQKVKSKRVPQVIVFVGPSGVGKTTICRILADKLECGIKARGANGKNPDLQEIDCSIGGVDLVRSIKQQINLSPLAGPCRVWILDELHLLGGASGAKGAQSALLKTLEEPPPNVYFFLATTEANKIIPTIRTRCTLVNLKPLNDKHLREIITVVLEKEKLPNLDSEVVDRLVDVANGSARKVLKDLEKIVQLTDPTEQLNAICSPESEKQAIDLARAIMDKRGKWNEVAAIIKDIKEEPETIRRLILAYASAVLLGSNRSAYGRAFLVLDLFEGGFLQPDKAGFASLVRACYAIFNDPTK